jgi:hypothetical protein
VRLDSSGGLSHDSSRGVRRGLFSRRRCRDLGECRWRGFGGVGGGVSVAEGLRSGRLKVGLRRAVYSAELRTGGRQK